MKCACGGETRVLETRLDASGRAVCRRRACGECQARMVTVEQVAQSASMPQKAAARTVAPATAGQTRGAKAPSQRAVGEARRRVEELRDLEEAQESFTMDDLRRELGWA